MAYKTNLVNADATFASMMENGFGIITVMNAKVYDAPDSEWFADRTAYDVVKDIASAKALLCELDTLKIANVTQEGPTKTITGGKYSNALIKFGKSARLEMQDALGRAKAIDALCGGVREWQAGYVNKTTGLHFGEDFQGPKTIVGESFFIDRNTGKQIDVNIVFYQFLPDSIFNLTQDAEGDASVFDMNGDLLTTEILLGTDGDEEDIHGVFYSIVDMAETTENDSPYEYIRSQISMINTTQEGSDDAFFRVFVKEDSKQTYYVFKPFSVDGEFVSYKTGPSITMSHLASAPQIYWTTADGLLGEGVSTMYQTSVSLPSNREVYFIAVTGTGGPSTITGTLHAVIETRKLKEE